MNVIEEYAWRGLRMALLNAKSIAWDGCHKIYVCMDDASHKEQLRCGYGSDADTFCIEVTDTIDAFNTVKSWWDKSCELRFVNAVVNGGHCSEDYVPIIRQFDEDDWS